MNNRNILSALIGLAGAMNNNGKTETTDQVVLAALLAEDSMEVVEKIRAEKFRISPNCATCEMPCGNTSDYNMNLWNQSPEEIILIKQRVVEGLTEIARRYRNAGKLPDVVYKAIAYLGYDLQIESYEIILEELSNG